jgi:serine protease Do
MPNTDQKRIFKSVNKVAILTVLFAFIAGILGGVIAVRVLPERVTSLNNTSTGQKIVSSQSELISSIAKEVSPSVVSINVDIKTQSNNLRMFFGIEDDEQSEAAGTGFIVSSDGVIVTNKHVIPENASKVSVTTSDGKTYDNVEVLARDPRSGYDIAFLKIKNVSNLKPAKIGDSSKMVTGDAVIAIGYALGEFENTVTSGIISGLGRPVTAGDGDGTAESLTNLFQTDAAINSGNSGGPLLNMNGEVIGINTAIASNAQNIGFSIPTNDVKAQITSILEKGKLQIPYLGVRYVMLTPQIKARYDLATDEGAWLKAANDKQAVINGSPADKAGLKEGDIIVKVNGQKIDQDNPLASVLGKYKIGETIEITYNRDGKEIKTKATLEVAPEN